MTDASSLADTLESYLHGLEQAGVSRVPLTSPYQPPRPAPASPPPAPKKVRGAPEKDTPASILPQPAPSTPVIPLDSETSHCTVWLDRMPDCGDTASETPPRILLVAEPGELEGDPRELLEEMLKAIGYQIEGDPERYPPSGPLPEGAARILVLGNSALQAASTAGMDLSIVRGMWQPSPAGKLIATYAPSALLDNPAGKKAVWGDLQLLLKDLGLEIPAWTKERLKKRP